MSEAHAHMIGTELWVLCERPHDVKEIHWGARDFQSLSRPISMYVTNIVGRLATGACELSSIPTNGVELLPEFATEVPLMDNSRWALPKGGHA